MANSGAFRLGPLPELSRGSLVPAAPESASRATAAAQGRTVARACALSSVAVGTPVQVDHLDLEDDLREWLRAVGIREGECLTVLRRAAFGGPVHVRTRSGGEFALNRSLAKSIVVSALPHDGE